MGIVILMVLGSVSLAVVFLFIFVIAAKKGQFDEDESPAVRMLKEDKVIKQDKDKIDT